MLKRHVSASGSASAMTAKSCSELLVGWKTNWNICVVMWKATRVSSMYKQAPIMFHLGDKESWRGKKRKQRKRGMSKALQERSCCWLGHTPRQWEGHRGRGGWRKATLPNVFFDLKHQMSQTQFTHCSKLTMMMDHFDFRNFKVSIVLTIFLSGWTSWQKMTCAQLL